jgi:hypothetical protein
LIYCKNICKCHNVPPPKTAIKNGSNELKTQPNNHEDNSQLLLHLIAYHSRNLKISRMGYISFKIREFIEFCQLTFKLQEFPRKKNQNYQGTLQFIIIFGKEEFENVQYFVGFIMHLYKIPHTLLHCI